MTGASIVRWEDGGAVVLALHGAFDGASAWAVRHAIDESPAREFVVDLTHAEEACDFAAALLATWTRQWRRAKRVAFRPGTREHARLLAGWGLELLEDDALPSAGAPAAAPSVVGPTRGASRPASVA
jgi:hypothetical protein